jgi:hypothetical protein
MQGMDRKYNGHAWSKLVTTNIKFLFRFNFRKARYLGLLRCVQDDCENFLQFAVHNETFWCGECVHIAILGQMTIFPPLLHLDANFVIIFLFVLPIEMGESIMLCINFNLC